MASHTKLIAAFMLFLSLVSPAWAASPYDEELGQLSGELRALMMRADRVRSDDDSGRQDLQEALFDLSKRLHRLEEEAGAADVALQQQGRSKDVGLVYAAGIAKTLDLACAHTSSFLYTRERAFRTAASVAMQTARTLSAAQ